MDNSDLDLTPQQRENRRRYQKSRDVIGNRVKLYYQEHKSERAAYHRQWCSQNHDRIRINAANRRARKRQAEGRYILAEWKVLLDAYGHRCLRCGRSAPEVALTADHVIPLACGGSNNIDNIQPLCLACNLWKKARTIDYRILAPQDRARAEILLGPVRGLKRSPLSPERRAKMAAVLNGAKNSAAFHKALSEGIRRAWQTRGPRPDSTSGVRGVLWDGESQRWRARVTVEGKRLTLGRFKTIAEAERAIVDHAHLSGRANDGNL